MSCPVFACASAARVSRFLSRSMVMKSGVTSTLFFAPRLRTAAHDVVALRHPVVPEADRQLSRGPAGADMHQRQGGGGGGQLQRTTTRCGLRLNHRVPSCFFGTDVRAILHGCPYAPCCTEAKGTAAREAMVHHWDLPQRTLRLRNCPTKLIWIDELVGSVSGLTDVCKIRGSQCENPSDHKQSGSQTQTSIEQLNQTPADTKNHSD